MKFRATKVAILLGALLALVILAPSQLTPATAGHSVPVTVTITRITNLGDEGIEDNLRGEADLYACVFVFADGLSSQLCTFDQHVDGDDDVEPFIPLTVNVPGELSSVSIVMEVWDHDGCPFARCFFDIDPFGESDDQGDADPGAGGNVDLILNLATGVWTGDTTGSCSAEDPNDTDSAVRLCWDISTLSTNGDLDQDGLLDSWETRGFDADGDGTIDVDLPTFGADPNHKDMFLELDFVTGQAPNAGAIAAMQAAFAAAPINAGGTNNNPDGQPGINLWVDTGGAAGGNNLGGGNSAAGTPGCLDAAFYTFKGANFNANRRWIFRYSIVGNPANNNPCNGGRGEIGGNDFIEFNHDGGTIMHEFGHNLNLRHGGNENNNCKPPYVSVMNYDNQFGIGQAGGGTIIDYSPPRFAGGRGVAPLPTIVEDNLNENSIMDATDPTNQFVFVNGLGQPVLNQLNGTVDWNGDGDRTDTGVSVNVDLGSSACANITPLPIIGCLFGGCTMTGHHDWSVIAINFRPFGDSADGAINPADEVVPTIEELLALQEALHTTDLSITKFDSPDPVVAGETLYYTLTVTNNGPNPANDVQVVDTLPAGLEYLTDTDSCTEGPVGTLTCDLGFIAANDSVSFQVAVHVPADYIATTGPVGITNTATVEDTGGNDSDASNNEVTATTIVEDRADLEVTKLCKPDDTVLAGEAWVCEMIVENLGPSYARDVRLRDDIVTSLANGFPFPGLTFDPNRGFQLCGLDVFVSDPHHALLDCGLGEPLEPKGSAGTGQWIMKVTIIAGEGQDINNCAQVFVGEGGTPDPNSANNQSCDGVHVVPVADLSITKSDDPDPVEAGTTITYTLEVTNNGPSTATNVVVSDIVPAGVFIVDVSGTGGASCVFGVPGDVTRPTTCNFGSMAPGDVETMTMVVDVNPGVLPVAHNDASVSSDTYDPDTSNNIDSEDTTINVADLRVVKTADKDIYKPSSTVMYTITITNLGTNDAADVTAYDWLPASSKVVYLFDTAGCTKALAVLTCPLGTIAAGETVSFNVYVRAKGSLGVITNRALVTSPTFDPVGSNNTSQKSVLIKGGVQ